MCYKAQRLLRNEFNDPPLTETITVIAGRRTDWMEPRRDSNISQREQRCANNKKSRTHVLQRSVSTRNTVNTKSKSTR